MRRYSPSRGRPLTPYEQTVERLTATPAGAWLFLHVLTRADPPVLRLSRGRASFTPGAPIGLLETTGAHSGRRRRTPLLYLADGEDDVVVIASNGGRAVQPAWLWNLRAQPRARFLSREHGWRSCVAHEAAGDERARLWSAVTDLFAGYEAYAARTGGREIPLVVLRRSCAAGDASIGSLNPRRPRRCGVL